MENAQVGVFLAYASRFGQALIDRRLYLPEAWAGDGERRAKAGVPAGIAFATKPAMARAMIAEALDAGVRPAFVLADALYGSDSGLRRMLEGREQPYVLAVRSTHHLRFLDGWGFVQTDPRTMADDLPPGDWATLAAGEGAKSLRLYDWARIPLPWTSPDAFERCLLIRRSRRDPAARAYYLVFCPTGTMLPELAGVAGLRWTIEECFQRAKDDLGLDHCEARSWRSLTEAPRSEAGWIGRRRCSWHRHMSLVMTAAAFLTRLAADLRRTTWDITDPDKANERSPKAVAA